MNRFKLWIMNNDTTVFQYINQQLRYKSLDFLLPKLTHMGGATFTLTTLILMIILTTSHYRTLAIQALLSLTFSHLFVHVIKKHYRRERPYIALDNVNLNANPLKDYSFPSGHTTAAFSTAVVFSLHSLLLAALLLPLAFIIGLSRMYLGLHYPTDCIIGALLGTISSFIVVSVTGMFL